MFKRRTSWAKGLSFLAEQVSDDDAHNRDADDGRKCGDSVEVEPENENWHAEQANPAEQAGFSKLLCCVSSILWANGVCTVFVGGHGAQQRIGQDQDFSSDGDEGNFAGFAARFERGVEGFHGGAVADGGDGSLVESNADFATATADRADVADGAAVVGVRSQADQSSDGLSAALAEFGQVNQEGSRNLRADANDGLENVVLGLEGFGVGNDAIHAVFEVLDLSFEEGHGFVDVLEDFWRRTLGGVAVIFFGSEHADELAPAVAEIAEFQDFLRRKRTNGGSDDFAEMGEDAGVDGVGFGELTGALGEVADLTGVDNDRRQVGGEQGADGGFLIRAGGLEDDSLGREGSDPGNELFNAGGRVGESFAQVSGSDMSVEKIFADVDADVEAVHGWYS